MGLQYRDLSERRFQRGCGTLRQAYTHLRENGTTLGTGVQTYEDGNRSMHDLMGFPEVWEFEKKWDLRDPDAPGS